jgi:hypothetical protein
VTNSKEFTMMMLMVMVINILILCLISGTHSGVSKVLAILGGHAAFCTAYWTHLQEESSPLFLGRLPWKMEIIGRPQTSVSSYKSMVRNISEERRPHSKSLLYTLVMHATSVPCELVSEKCVIFNELICRCYFISLLTVRPETSIYIRQHIR